MSRCPRYTIAPGRAILRDGKPFITIRRDEAASPIEADRVAKRIARFLDQGRRCELDRARMKRKPKIRRSR